MNRKHMKLGAVMVAALALAGCAAVAPTPDYDAMLQSMMKASFRDQGIAKVDRLQQDAANAQCSQVQGKDLPDATAKAIESANLAESMGLNGSQILLSCKVSGVQDLISVYRELARRCDYALHLGLTEAGMGTKGTVASAAALSVLLQEGIGDTIRVSLTPQPGEARTQEVVVASEILQALGMRVFVPSVTACPGCGRTTSTTFQDLAKQIDDFLRAQMPVWRVRYPGVETLRVAVMGCIVNGPGESKHADIGISLPGTGEVPAAPVFIDGEKAMTLRGDDIANEFHRIVEQYIEKRFGAGVAAA